MRASSGATANSGVPMYTMRVFLKKPAMRDLTFLHVDLSWSVLNALSCAAFQTRYVPIGTSTYNGMNAPLKGDTAPSLASLVPVRSTTQ